VSDGSGIADYRPSARVTQAASPGPVGPSWEDVQRIVEVTMLLVFGGAALGSLTGTICLMLLFLPSIQEWRAGYGAFFLAMGTFAGAPLGALAAPLLGWSVLRRIPVGRAVLVTPCGTLVGSFTALAVGWLFEDIADGRGIFYLVTGAVIGLVVTALVLRARYGDRGDVAW